MTRAPRCLAATFAGFAALVGCREPNAAADAAVAGGVEVVAELPAPEPWKRIDQPSLAACGICHLDVWEEWDASLHHHAWDNANVRAATDDFRQAGCRACHSPQPVLATGLDRRPEYRDFNQHDGVHCLACHGLADGVAARHDRPDAPCRPRATPELVAVELCWPCHEPTHQAFEEYRTSDAAAVGVRCADCHMPHAEGRTGRSHGPFGGLNREFVKQAVAFSARRDGGTVTVTLRNRTGHKFPGEIPSRVAVLRLTADGAEPRHVAFSKPAKGETREDDRLGVDETRSFVFEVGAARDVAVALLFKPFPLLTDDEAFVLAEWRDPPLGD